MFRSLLVLTLLVSGFAPVQSQVFRGQQTESARRAIIIPLHKQIGFVSGAMLKRKFAQAIDDGAEVIILDINSPGGLTMVTFDLMDMVLDAKDVETVAWVQRDAISGAAMLALSCDKILIRPDARIGDAGEIVAGPDGAYRYTEAKSRSVLAQKVRDTARATGRPIALAEKLVDKDLIVYSATDNESGEPTFVTDRELESMDEAAKAGLTVGKPVREAGEDMFFTVNGRRAVELGFADGTVEAKSDLVEQLGLAEPIPVYEATGMDTFIWIMNSNVMAFLLIATGLIALLVEMAAPGIGVGAIISTLCFAMFFWSRFLGGTSGWLEVTLFVVGLAFIALEVFVVPGFGIPGVTGFALVVGSLVMASRRSVVPMMSESWSEFGWDLLTPVAAMAAFGVAALIAASMMDSIPGLSRLTLKPPTSDAGYVGEAVQSVADATPPLWQRIAIGDLATADSPLRPTGRIRVGDELMDASTQGDFVDVGTDVTVIAKEGRRIVVKPV